MTDDVHAGLRRFAKQWFGAIDRTTYVAMSSRTAEDLLIGFTGRLVAALLSDPFHPDGAQEVGAGLVEVNFVGGAALGSTIHVLGEALIDLCDVKPVPGESDVELRSRLTSVQSALATGFVAQWRTTILGQQEGARRAVLTARDDAERRRHVSEARFRALFEKSAVGIVLADLDGAITHANQAMAGLLSCTVGEVTAMTMADVLDASSDLREAHAEMVRGRRDHARHEAMIVRRDGTSGWAHVALSLIRDGDGLPHYTVAMFEDVTERRDLHLRLRHQATHDSLTGLANRALFVERVGQVLSSGGPTSRLGLCYLDLDGFKTVNDSLGHDVGDELLITIGERLDTTVSSDTHMVARMGGDEFVILIEDSTDDSQIIELADKVLATLAEPVHLRGHDLAVSASIGIVERAVDNANLPELLQAADITLYRAKAQGKGRWATYDAKLNDQQVTRHTLAATMPAGLERDEFVVDYQPLVSLENGRMTGVESLVRWQHPKYGLLSPGTFVELAEETGHIVRLGRKILAESCRQAAVWRAVAGERAPYVSVNVSVRQCHEKSLVDDVAGILDETGLPPEWLQLEITESAILGTSDAEAIAALGSLAAMGIRIAIDDFGTGYSNLSYLPRLPVHTLKLAGSFMDGLRCSDQGVSGQVNREIVSAMINLAHILKLSVIAEGVETPLQVRQLRELGADIAQGYLFAKPGPPDRISALLAGPGNIMPDELR